MVQLVFTQILVFQHILIVLDYIFLTIQFKIIQTKNIRLAFHPIGLSLHILASHLFLSQDYTLFYTCMFTFITIPTGQKMARPRAEQGLSIYV